MACFNRPCFIICGTKADLRQKSDPFLSMRNKFCFVDISSAQNVAMAVKASGPIECSAKEDINVKEIFKKAIKQVLLSRKPIVDGCILL